MEARITYRDRPQGPVESWAIRVGTREEIMRSARELLADLREEWARAAVWVAGKRVTLGRKSDG